MAERGQTPPAQPRRINLWWVCVGWIVVFIAGANLHQWAIRNREVAEALLIVYASALYAVGTWWLAGWADREMERRRWQDQQRP